MNLCFPSCRQVLGKSKNSEKLSWDRLKNLTRGYAFISALPDIDTKGVLHKNTTIVEYTEQQLVTDVLQMKLIPTQDVVKEWDRQLKEVMKKKPDDSFYYLQNRDLRLDVEAIGKMMTIHRALELRHDVEEELFWIQSAAVGVANQMADVQQKPPSIPFTQFKSIIRDGKVDDVLEEFDMNSGELAQICCSRKVTGKHIKWIMKKLNELQLDVLPIYPAVQSPSTIKKYMEDLQNANGKRSAPQAILFVFTVDEVHKETTFVSKYRHGSHFTLAYVDPYKNEIVYADSLGRPCPNDLLDITSPYCEAVYKTKIQLKKYDVKLVHDPNTTDNKGVHVCSSKCATFYPFQRCQNLDGIIVCIITAIACLKPNLFHFLTRPQPTANLKTLHHLKHPTSHSEFLRKVLLSWFGNKSITIDHVTPQHFDEYQVFATYQATTMANIPSYCLLPYVSNVCGMVEIIYANPEDKSVERFTKETIHSFTRILTAGKTLPTISANEDGSVATFSEQQAVTDVFRLASIPDETTLRHWERQLTHCSETALDDTFAYVKAGKEMYNEEGVQQMLNLHKAIAIKENVEKEVQWIKECRQLVHPQVIVQPGKDALEEFQSLVHYRVWYQILEDYLLSSEELAQICCDRWVSTGLIEWVLSLLNATQKDVVAICLPARSGSSLPDLSSEEPRSLAVVLSIGAAADGVCITDTPGCHTSFCYVDISSKHMIYCDSLGCPPPKNMTSLMATSFEAVFGVALPDCQIRCVHQPITDILEEDHHCKSECAIYYPLQTCGSIAGVLSIIMAAIACLSPDFFRSLTEVSQVSSYESIHFIQRPSENSMYLRLVLATWFAERKINIGNVIPAELMTSFTTRIFHQVPLLGSRKLTADTIKSYTRADTTSMWLPESSPAYSGALRGYDTEESVADVFNKHIIPDELLLHQWQEAIKGYQKASCDETRVYYEVIGEQYAYDTDCINRLLSLHQARRIQRRVHEELRWFDMYPIIPVHVAKLPSQESLHTFQDIIHNNKVDEPLEVYNMTSDTLADIVCNRHLHQSHVQWILNQLNEMQTKILCVQPIMLEDTVTPILPQDSTPTATLFVFSVERSLEGMKIVGSSEPATHFSICYVNLESKQITYGDSLGWPVPSNLIQVVEDALEKILGTPLKGFKLCVCHDPETTLDNETHMCAKYFCAANFPLQTSDNLGGVVSVILAAIACLSPGYFNFLTTSMKRIALFSSLHLQRPHDVYLRQVVASWFANKRLDIRNVLPKDLDTNREYSEKGSE